MKSVLSILKIAIIPLILLLMPVIGQAGDYEIEKVIEVGPCSGVPMTWPLKWSPDGTKLAYFYDNSLYISDTLGNYEQIAHFDLYPHRYEWLSNKEIVIHLQDYLSEPQPHKLVKVEIENSQTFVLEDFLRPRGKRLKNYPNSFTGPFLSVEGRLYYRTNVLRANVLDPIIRNEPRPIVFPESKYPRNINRLPAEKNHIVSWGKNELFRFTGEFGDSIIIAPKPYNNMLLTPKFSKDMDYYIHGGIMYNFIDSSYIVLDTVVKEFPPNTGATDFMYVSFNPKFDEVLFQLVYHDADEYELFTIGTFNYKTYEFTFIDPLINKEGCRTPEYSPDGLKIAFWQGGNVHILYRRGL